MYFKLMKIEDNSVKGAAVIMDVGESLVFVDALRRYAHDNTVNEKDRKTAEAMTETIGGELRSEDDQRR